MEKLLSQTQYAEHRGISQSRVSRMVSSGKIPKSCIKRISGRKLIDRDAADNALKENLDRIYNPNPKKKSKPKVTEKDMVKKNQIAGTGGLSLADAQKVQAQYKAALLKLEYDEKKGSLVDAAQVEDDFFNIARRTRDAILNIPGRISAELASSTDQHFVNEKLTQEIVMALEELSR